MIYFTTVLSLRPQSGVLLTIPSTHCLRFGNCEFQEFAGRAGRVWRDELHHLGYSRFAREIVLLGQFIGYDCRGFYDGTHEVWISSVRNNYKS